MQKIKFSLSFGLLTLVSILAWTQQNAVVDANSVAPGGVSGDLTLWLKADSGVTSNSGQVSLWEDLLDIEIDTGLSNVALELSSVGADGIFGTADDISTDTTTNSDGLYVFTDVGAGSFSVVETDPTGYISVGSNRVDVTLLATGAAVANFADIETGTVSGIVFEDTNDNGQQDMGEFPFVGVAIKLISAGADDEFETADDVTTDSTTTGANGTYSFSNVSPDTYLVESTNLANYESISDDNVLVSVVSGGAAVANFTDQSEGMVSGSIFDDRNFNGIRDSADVGVIGVTVELISLGADETAGSDDDSVLNTTTTDTRGNYQFTDVEAGVYLVQHQTVQGFVDISQPDVMVVVAVDGSGVANFNLQSAGTVSGIVYHNVNGTYHFEQADNGLSGVTVQLYTAGADGFISTDDDELQHTTTTNVSDPSVLSEWIYLFVNRSCMALYS